jgi:hypothetical protein
MFTVYVENVSCGKPVLIDLQLSLTMSMMCLLANCRWRVQRRLNWTHAFNLKTFPIIIVSACFFFKISVQNIIKNNKKISHIFRLCVIILKNSITIKKKTS